MRAIHPAQYLALAKVEDATVEHMSGLGFDVTHEQAIVEALRSAAVMVTDARLARQHLSDFRKENERHLSPFAKDVVDDILADWKAEV